MHPSSSTYLVTAGWVGSFSPATLSTSSLGDRTVFPCQMRLKKIRHPFRKFWVCSGVFSQVVVLKNPKGRRPGGIVIRFTNHLSWLLQCKGTVVLVWAPSGCPSSSPYLRQSPVSLWRKLISLLVSSVSFFWWRITTVRCDPYRTADATPNHLSISHSILLSLVNKTPR